MTTLTQPRAAEPLGVALVLAATLHALVLLSVRFEFEPRAPVQDTGHNMEIILVRQAQPKKTPEQADYLAQTSQEGGGTQEQKARPKSPAVRPDPRPREQPTPEARSAASPEPVKPPRRHELTAETSQRRQTEAQPQEIPARRQLDTAQILASARHEIARLSNEFDEIEQRDAKRSRRKYINASTQEYKYAAYLEAWRKKVEAVGNLNYPEEAKRRKLYGDLVLHVALRSDGSVEELRILKSSGHKLLDDAAIHIVELAAPFAPFSADIRQEIDILDITRTWQFMNSNQLFAR